MCWICPGALAQASVRMPDADRQVITVNVVEHNNALHAGAIDQQAQIVFGSLHRRCVVVLTDRAANDDAGFSIDASQNGVENLATDIVKVDINAFWAMLLQAVLDCRRANLVINTGVESEFLDDPVAFGGSPCDSDDSTALDLCNLPYRLTDRSGRATDDQCFAGLRLAYIHQAEVTGHAGHAEDVQPLSNAASSQINLEDAAGLYLAGRNQTIFLCAQTGVDRVADLVNAELREATTTPIPPARMTSPMPTGGM